MQGKSPFDFSPESFQCLGINITHSFQGLHGNNIDKLINKVSTEVVKLAIVISRQSAKYKDICLLFSNV